MVPKFSTKSTWNSIRRTAPLIPWHDLVWFKEEIPRCSFVNWIAMIARLPTRDKLTSWGIDVRTSCVLCNSGSESHQKFLSMHLFYRGLVTLLSRLPYSPPDSLITVSDPLAQPQLASSSGKCIVTDLLFQVIVYSLWREKLSYFLRYALTYLCTCR